MKITILNGDNSLGIDNEFFIGLDFSEVPDEINAVHWKDDVGVIEYLNSTNKLDDSITELPSFCDGLKAQWDTLKAEKIQAEIDHQAFIEQVEATSNEIAIEEAKYKQWLIDEEARKKEQELNPDPYLAPTIPK
jgi:hypothetical protein